MEHILFAEMINIADLQRIQDLSSDETGAAPIIILPNNTPLPVQLIFVLFFRYYSKNRKSQIDKTYFESKI